MARDSAISNDAVLSYPTISPYLICAGAADALTFYTETLGGSERMRLPGPDGTVMHAEVAFGDAVIMLADEFPDRGFLGPKSIGGTPVTLMVYVDNCDAAYEKAIAAGAVSQQEPTDQFYGDRTARIEDPFGHIWTLTQKIEDLTIGQVEQRMAEMMGGD